MRATPTQRQDGAARDARKPACRAWGRAALAAGLIAAAIGIVGGCGGGVDSGGTGAPVAGSYAAGPISGFGSVIVGDVHYDERNAAISDADGNARSRDDLKLGMTIEVNGTPVVTDASGLSSSTASTIVYASALLGPVTAVDVSLNRLTVLGQTVDVGAATVFDASAAGGVASLAVGDIVEVYALPDYAAARYVATRIERRAAPPAAYTIRAAIGNLDTAARTYMLGALAVSYAGADVGAATLANGRIVEAWLATAPVAGVWQATRVRDASPQIRDHDESRIEGLVTAFTSSNQFSVAGVAIDARNAEFPDGRAGIVLETRVRVEGTASASGLTATRVELRNDDAQQDEFELDGPIATLDAAAHTFTVRGVVVRYTDAVDFRDGTAADLAVGRQVEVRGPLSADGTEVAATRIRFR